MGSKLALATVPLVLGAVVLRRVLRTYFTYEGMHACACPVDGTPALVTLRPWHAALTDVRGRLSLEVADCSRWPERATCTRGCVQEIRENCRLLAGASR